MKVGDLVRIPPREKYMSQHPLYQGGIGIIVDTYSAFPHDMYQEINSCIVTEPSGRLSTWYDWQLEIICNNMHA